MSVEIAFLVELETAVWRALVAGDSEAGRSLLSYGFLGVYPSGFATRSDHAAQLLEGPTVARFQLEEVRVVDISERAALLSYLATYARPASGSSSERMYVTSLWEEIGGSWLNTFSQDTPAS